jgi:hypothetical protein
LIDFIVFNATFSNISAISWRPDLVVEEAGVAGENHRPCMGKQLTSMSRVPSRMRKTMYNEWGFFQLRIECIFWEFYWRVKAWTEAHFV